MTNLTNLTPDEQDLREFMERSLTDVRGDSPRFEAHAVTRGRVLRRRHRVTSGLVGTAVVAAVAALVIPATLGGGAGGSTDSLVSDRGGRDPGQTEPGPVTLAPPGWWDMPSSQMLRRLEQVLPEGVTVKSAATTLDQPGPDVEGAGSLSGILSASTGPGSFQILLWPPDLPPGDETAVQPSLEGRIQCRAYHDTCVPIRDAAGDQVGRASSDTERGTLVYEVTLLGPDGGGLNLTVMNSSGEKPGYQPPSAELPPLTLGQLRTIAESETWTGWKP